jgi:amidase
MLIASYCGLYGLRPSWGRVSFKDASEAFAGMETRHATAGPMGHSPEDLDLFMSSYMAANPWNMDPSVLHMPWRSMIHEISETPLCFAVSYGDEEVGSG